MIKIEGPRNEYATRLLNAFSQFRKIHWRPPHIKDLKPSEFMVLHTVKRSFMDGGDNGLMVSEISDLLNVARPTVTQLVNSLQKKGFLEKRHDEADRRVVRVHLSEKGRNIARQGAEEFYRLFVGLAEHLGSRKSDDLSALLEEVFVYFKTKEHKEGQ